MLKQTLGAVVVGGLFASTAGAAIINVGANTVAQNATAAEVDISVTGGEAVTGFNLKAVIGNGTLAGSEPIFSTISYAGTLWPVASSTVTGGPVTGATMDADSSIVINTAGQTVPATGLVVKLFINTTGFAVGNTFPLSLTANQVGSSNFNVVGGGTLAPTITNGTITVVPEPTTVGVIAAGGLALLGRRRRRA